MGSASTLIDSPIILTPTSKVASNRGYILPEMDAFRTLRREPILSGAVKELRKLQDLQDSRLRACEEKGEFWEQCFMYGQDDDGIDVAGENRGRMDSQLISPVGSINPASSASKIPTW